MNMFQVKCNNIIVKEAEPMHLHDKDRPTASHIKAVIMLSVVLAGCAFVPLAAQQAKVTVPVNNTQGKKATLPELYAMFFNYAVHVEVTADSDTAQGRDSSFFRAHLQKASGLTASEYALVLASAQQFVAVDASVKAQISDQLKYIRAQKAQGVRVTKGQPTPAQLAIKNLLQQRSSALSDATMQVHAQLGQKGTEIFEAYLQTGYRTRSLGPVKHAQQPTIAKSQGLKVKASPENVTLDSAWECDDDDYVCVDPQISYRSEGMIDLWSYVDTGESWDDDFDDGVVEYYTDCDGDVCDTGTLIAPIYDTGQLWINGSNSGNFCGSGSSAACPGPGWDSVSTDINYSWYAIGDLYWSYVGDECYYDDGNDGPCYENSQATSYDLNIPTPDISSITPNSVDPGASGTFVIDGEGLISPFQNTPTVTVTDQSGVFSSFTVQSFDYSAGTITVAYTLLANADPGPETITVDNGFAKDTVEITVTPPAPVITSITVSDVSAYPDDVGDLIAGNTQTVTLIGQNFGSTVPTISVSADSAYITIVSGSVSQPSLKRAKVGTKTMTSSTPTRSAKSSVHADDVWNTDQTISFNVQVADDITNSDASFELQVNDGASDTTAMSPEVAAVAVTPTPQIMIVNTPADLANCQNGTIAPNGANETDVFAGQQVLLCVSPPPAGLVIQSQSWSFVNNADITGGFTNAANGLNQPGNGPPSGAAGGTSFSPVMNQSGLTFYFLNIGGAETATYKWILNNGDSSGASSTADFNISGPTSVTVSDPESAVNLTMESGSPVFRMGIQAIKQVGIRFFASATFSNGTGGTNQQFQWVQLISDSNQLLQSNQITTYKTVGSPVAAIDNFYPYPYPQASGPSTTNDSPGSAALGTNQESEYGRIFTATTYLMWDPALPSGCTPAYSVAFTGGGYSPPFTSTCTSTPIPLGSVVWGTSACAIDTLQNTALQGWVLSCSTPEQANNGPQLNTASGFPQWTNQALSIGQPGQFGNDVKTVTPQ
jgi:hypothetical protein